MRTKILAALFLFSMGVMIVNDMATAQDKKDEKKPNPRKDEMPPEKVSLRVWDKQRGQFLKAQDEIDATRKDDAKRGTVFYLSGRGVIPVTGHATVGSEITDKDGKVYVVNKATKGTNLYVCDTSPKEVPKKPD
jgi:hypothetical protein